MIKMTFRKNINIFQDKLSKTKQLITNVGIHCEIINDVPFSMEKSIGKKCHLNFLNNIKIKIDYAINIK